MMAGAEIVICKHIEVKYNWTVGTFWKSLQKMKRLRKQHLTCHDQPIFSFLSQRVRVFFFACMCYRYNYCAICFQHASFPPYINDFVFLNSGRKHMKDFIAITTRRCTAPPLLTSFCFSSLPCSSFMTLFVLQHLFIPGRVGRGDGLCLLGVAATGRWWLWFQRMPLFIVIDSYDFKKKEKKNIHPLLNLTLNL